MHTHFSIETVTKDFATFSNVLYKNDYEDSFTFLNTVIPKLIGYYQSDPDLAFKKVSNDSGFLFAQNSQQRVFDFNIKDELLVIE